MLVFAAAIAWRAYHFGFPGAKPFADYPVSSYSLFLKVFFIGCRPLHSYPFINCCLAPAIGIRLYLHFQMSPFPQQFVQVIKFARFSTIDCSFIKSKVKPVYQINIAQLHTGIFFVSKGHSPLLCARGPYSRGTWPAGIIRWIIRSFHIPFKFRFVHRRWAYFNSSRNVRLRFTFIRGYVA